MNELEDLDVKLALDIKREKEKIGVLFSKFEKRMKPKTRVPAALVGQFIAEYVLRIKTASIDEDGDKILLDCRRLLEVLIVSKYINKNNSFVKFIACCRYDRYDFLENLDKVTKANKKLFPERKDLFTERKWIADEKEKIISDGSKIVKLPQISQMAEDVGYAEEYSSFYKIMSKLLHFCPFSLIGDIPGKDKKEKIQYFIRIWRYLSEIKKELDLIYEKTKPDNL